MNNNTKEVNDVISIYTSIFMWAVLPPLATTIVHKGLVLMRILAPASASNQKRTQFHRRLIHTSLLVLYVLSEYYSAISSLPVTHYTTLGVSPNDMDTMKSNYRRLSLKYHPDKAPSGLSDEYDAHYMGIRKAYDAISDETLEKVYNRMGTVECGSCVTWLDWMTAYATEPLMFYFSMILAVMINFGMTKNAHGLANRMSVLMMVCAVEMGIVTGRFEFAGPVPAFVLITMLRKTVLIYTMLVAQLGNVWSEPTVTVPVLLQNMKEMDKIRNDALEDIANKWFIPSESFNQQVSGVLRDILLARQ